MSKHTAERVGTPDCRRVGGGLMLGALASGALAIGAFSSAGQANATCVSAGGWFTIGSGCVTSAPGDFALAIGPGATATATGGQNTAISWGSGASATAVGVHNVAIGSGLGATAQAVGHDNTAIAIGDPSTGSGGGMQNNLAVGTRSTPTTAIAGIPLNRTSDAADFASQPDYSHNTAIAIGRGTQAIATGGDNNTALAFGDRSLAVAGQGGVAGPFPNLTSNISDPRLPSNNNVAIVRGSDSRAIAGSAARQNVFDTRGVAGTTDEEPTSRDNNNVAIVRGNHSTALAGDGDNNRARVFGSHSRASAFGGNQSVTTVGDNKPPAEN